MLLSLKRAVVFGISIIATIGSFVDAAMAQSPAPTELPAITVTAPSPIVRRKPVPSRSATSIAPARRVNAISPGIIITPLAKDELEGPRGAGYRRMIEVSAVGRAGTPDEVGTVGALLMGSEGAFITGSDFLMDGGVTAAYWFGELAPK